MSIYLFLQFQLRFSLTLANKPKGPPAQTKNNEKPFDPFAYEPRPKLFIEDIGPAHYLVLNKFAITPEHFIIATKDFAPQTHILEEGDLEAALECIRAYDGELFVFFNCGQHSGASQPHRHLQLLPISSMRDGLAPDSPWKVLASSDNIDGAPFSVFRESISTETTAADLHAAYLRLYRKACREVSNAKGWTVKDKEHETTGEAQISYNLAMTKDTLVVCPRISDGGAIRVSGSEEAIGSLSLNGTLLAGTALVKSETEWNALKSDPSALEQILRTVGVPSQNQTTKL